ncbi:hypothetical protein Aperf_G00000104651 [Anoplocephala perfoliata]
MDQDCILSVNSMEQKNLNDSLRNCSHNITTTEWVLDPVTYDIRGLWSCIHGKEIASVHIDVNVPQRLDSLKLELPTLNVMQSASGIASYAVPGEGFSVGAGTRSDPLDLILAKRFGIKNFILECSSHCASETRQLVWTSLNNTMYRKYPSFLTSHEERTNCPNNLSFAKTRALITCAVGYQPGKWEPESSVSVDLKLPLVGLNIVFCSNEQLTRISSVRNYHCINGFLNGNSTTACAYVLCDGPQPPVLTSGEQSAIVIGALALVLMIIVMCVSTWRSRKSRKAARMNQYNGALNSHHNQEAQMELML